MNTPSTSVSPGLGGFIAFFVLALALWLLMRNMNSRLRRMRFREEEAARGAQPPAQGPAESGESGEESDGSATAATDEGDDDRQPPAQDRRPPAQDRRPPAQG